MAICPFCGAKVDGGHGFCGKCGKAQPAQQASKPEYMKLALGIAVILGLALAYVISELPPEPVQPKPPATAIQETAKEIQAWGGRNIFRNLMERNLLSAGLDIELATITDNEHAPHPHNDHLLVRGEAVNRPFVHNFLGAEARRGLKKYGFTQVTFTKKFIGDVVAKYDVASERISYEER